MEENTSANSQNNLSNGPDFNGDGYDDLVVGATGERYGDGIASGAITILFGGPDKQFSDSLELHQDLLNIQGNNEPYDRFGSRTIHGDFNGDGLDDLIVSAPQKDVDGFHPMNVGNLSSGYDSSIPCTPLGCSLLLKKAEKNLSGKHAVVIGRSNLNGKPMTQLLLKENCTVTITHSKTKDLKAECLRADIIIAAVGIPKLVKGDWVKKGAIVIDVGINKTDSGIVGDVDFDQVSKVAKAITPVPGGVGPMTIACLLSNTVECFKKLN